MSEQATVLDDARRREIIAKEVETYFSFEKMGPRKAAWLNQALRVIRQGLDEDPVARARFDETG